MKSTQKLEVVHTHSKFATSYAQAGKSIKNLGTTHSDYSEIEILCTRGLKSNEIKNNYELNTGHLIVKTLGQMKINPLWTPGILVTPWSICMGGRCK